MVAVTYFEYYIAALAVVWKCYCGNSVIYSCETKIPLLRRKGFDCCIEKKKSGTINFPECSVHNSCQGEKGIHHTTGARAPFSYSEKSSMKMWLKLGVRRFYFIDKRGAQSSHNFVNSFRSQSRILRARNATTKFDQAHDFLLLFTGYRGNKMSPCDETTGVEASPKAHRQEQQDFRTWAHRTTHTKHSPRHRSGVG